MSQHGSPESDQGECWSFAKPHTFQHHTDALFAARLCLLSAAASWPVLFSPFLACTCSLLCPLGVFVPPWSSPSATKHSIVIPGTRLILIAVFSPPRSISSSCMSFLSVVMLVTPVRFCSCFDFVFPCFPCLFACSVGSFTLPETKLSSSPLGFFSLLHFTMWVCNSFKVQAGS